ncbi:hypothetical protein WQ57_12880 [Mesobacillus campisalis]|uniref:Cell wall elongation regulator TseB-like domain-containing protein n=1 Tax=Mesobacillus campisalis TaxID=1408103 RepID=A0A0M2SSR3_9BACI|nr:DUF5590 domain-containing protein [Mesobacillus campisalis]KKK37624.1 hypothetical protein WQ57_12880 [Mesobacillus campisalis]
MKKWIILSTLFVIVSGAAAALLYYNAVKPLRTAEEKALAIANDETDLSGFQDFQLYNGEETYYVLKGRDGDEEEAFVWISEDGEKIITKKASSGVNKEEAVKTVYGDRKPKEILDVRLGITMLQKTVRPAWEIFYRSENDRLNYYYVDFETGEKLRAINNF